MIRSTLYHSSFMHHTRKGFSLIELMIAMVLGLVVVAGITSLFISNLHTYRSNRALGEIQTNARIAFELLSRDIRQVSAAGCNSQGNHLMKALEKGPNNATWGAWPHAVIGYAGADPLIGANRAGQTQSLQLVGAQGATWSAKNYDPATHQFTIYGGKTDIGVGDPIMVCDFTHAYIMKVDAVNPGGSLITVDAPPTGYGFAGHAQLSKITASDWFIGKNNAGGLSLYRLTANFGGQRKTEIVRHVTDMRFAFHVKGADSFVPPGAVNKDDWGKVDAIRMTLTVTSDQANGTDNKPLERTFTTTTQIRNRAF